MSDNNMIRRGDVLEILFDEGWYGNTLSRVDALPAVDVKELVEAATGVMARLVVAFPDAETYPPTARLAAALAAFEKEK